MAEKDYTLMLNITYELEGLLVLLGQRDDERADSVRRLAIEKVDLLRSMMMDEGSAGKADDCRAGKPADDLPVENTVRLPAYQPAETLEQADPELAEIESMPEATPDPPTEQDNGKDNDKVEETEQGTRGSSAYTVKPLVFTLNDKFRFRRELFANNDMEFADALNVLSAMANLSEAEDYLYNDLCWDPSNEDVQAFMAILTDHFKE